MNRQRKILSILLGVLVVALIYGVATYPRRERASSGPPKGAIKPQVIPGGENRPVSPPEGVRTAEEESEEAKGKEAGVERNIFEPLFPRVVPPVPAVPVQGIVGESTPVVELPPPPPPFKLLGYLQKNQDRIIFLSQNNELFIVRPEEPFGESDQYRIIEAGPEKVVLEETGKGENTNLFFAASDSAIGQGGKPFSRMDRRFQGPPAGRVLPLPEPPDELDSEPLETEERPASPSPEAPESPKETPKRSPLAPGLIGPEDTKNDVSIPEEDAAPSIDEVVDE